MTRSLDSLNVTLTVVRVSLSVKNGTFTLKDSCGGSLFVSENHTNEQFQGSSIVSLYGIQ